jgi:hypothetical protein
MSALSLEDVPVRAVPHINGLPPLTPDDAPDISGVPEFSCETCGKELHYGGRGRKPKFCDEHKRNSSTRSSGSTTSNEKIASAALDILVQANNLCGMGLMLMQMPQTASAIAMREDAFRVQALEALKADPALCRMILKAGATSGKAMLFMAYGMLAISIAPVALEEIKAKKAAKAEQDEESEG